MQTVVTHMFYVDVSFSEQPISNETEHWYNETYPDWSTSEGSRDTCVDCKTLTLELEWRLDHRDTECLQICPDSAFQTCQWIT